MTTQSIQHQLSQLYIQLNAAQTVSERHSAFNQIKLLERQLESLADQSPVF